MSNILLAVDGSDNSYRAAQECIKYAACMEASRVHLIYVADFAKAKNEVLHAGGREQLEAARKKRLAPVEALLQEKQIPYEVHILHGDPAPVIVEFANEQKPDLVVVGSRGLNSLQEMVLGSVSHKVVKRVQAPVLVVK